ncbi:MAG: helix-turn-helix domain-containing protein [Clostridia bacterium]|nr:helix-turn-helix domain-containing protein [Clostridia bacterium]
MSNKEMSSTLKKVINYIESKIKNEEIISNKNIAKYVGYDEQYLSKKFKDTFDMTMQKYITKRKMDLASRDLLETNNLVRAIASKYGYSEDGFIKAFTKFNKITPKQFRKNGVMRNEFSRITICDDYEKELANFFKFESYDIKEKSEIKLIGIIESSEFMNLDFYMECMYFIEDKLKEELGECVSDNFIELKQFQENHFEYMLATIYNEFDEYSNSLEIKTLPRQKWLIIKGKSFSKKEAIEYSTSYGINKILPNLKKYKEDLNSYIIAFDRYNFVEYYEELTEEPVKLNVGVEVWIPIIEK